MMEFTFIRMVEIVFIAIIAILTAVWLVTSFIKSAKTSAIRAEVEKEYQEKHKRLKSEFAEKEAALKERERKAAYHLEREKSFASRWQQLIDRERKVEERERELKEKGEDLPEWMSSSEEICDILLKCKKAANGIGLEMLGIDPILTDLFLAGKTDSCKMLFSIWRKAKEHRENIFQWLEDIKNLMGTCPMETPICELNRGEG